MWRRVGSSVRTSWSSVPGTSRCLWKRRLCGWRYSWHRIPVTWASLTTARCKDLCTGSQVKTTGQEHTVESLHKPLGTALTETTHLVCNRLRPPHVHSCTSTDTNYRHQFAPRFSHVQCKLVPFARYSCAALYALYGELDPCRTLLVRADTACGAFLSRAADSFDLYSASCCDVW